jgi:hypothetical protein
MSLENLIAPRVVFHLSNALHPGPLKAEVDPADT